MVEFGQTNERYHTPVCGCCANSLSRNTANKWVIPYWLDGHGTIHTYVPMELSDLKFTENQLVALASSLLSLNHLKNGTLGSRGGHCVERRT
jgi:hypothetical protein